VKSSDDDAQCHRGTQYAARQAAHLRRFVQLVSPAMAARPVTTAATVLTVPEAFPAASVAAADAATSAAAGASLSALAPPQPPSLMVSPPPYAVRIQSNAGVDWPCVQEGSCLSVGLQGLLWLEDLNVHIVLPQRMPALKEAPPDPPLPPNHRFLLDAGHDDDYYSIYDYEAGYDYYNSMPSEPNGQEGIGAIAHYRVEVKEAQDKKRWLDARHRSQHRGHGVSNQASTSGRSRSRAARAEKVAEGSRLRTTS